MRVPIIGGINKNWDVGTEILTHGDFAHCWPKVKVDNGMGSVGPNLPHIALTKPSMSPDFLSCLFRSSGLIG